MRVPAMSDARSRSRHQNLRLIASVILAVLAVPCFFIQWWIGFLLMTVGAPMLIDELIGRALRRHDAISKR